MNKRKIIIVDDEQDYREGLSEFLSRDAEVVAYSHPDEFAQNHQDAGSLDQVDLIILDYCFDTFTAHDKDLASFIRDDLNYRNNMVLWSLEDNVSSDFKKHCNAILPKKLMTFPEIRQCIEQQN